MREFSFGNLTAPVLMGVVNVTPDSFSDGGRYLPAADAVAQARKLAADGAGMLDLGAEATSFFRAGVKAVPAADQLARLLPVLGGLRDLADSMVISVDTRSAAVARAVLAEGARVINDVSAGTHEPEILQAVAKAGAGVILMHTSAGYPATPAQDEADVTGMVRAYLEQRAAAALAAGVRPDRIAIDPGIGFGKTMADNWRLLAGWEALVATGWPVVIGASRKRFLETRPPPGVFPTWDATVAMIARAAGGVSDVHPRDAASAAVVRLTASSGAAIHRVHHVTLARTALTM